MRVVEFLGIFGYEHFCVPEIAFHMKLIELRDARAKRLIHAGGRAVEWIVGLRKQAASGGEGEQRWSEHLILDYIGTVGLKKKTK